MNTIIRSTIQTTSGNSCYSVPFRNIYSVITMAYYDGGGGGRPNRGHYYRNRQQGYRSGYDDGTDTQHDSFGHDKNHGYRQRRRYCSEDTGEMDGQTKRERGGRGRPPPGLKGKEIGMYYAKLSKEKKKMREKVERPVVQIDKFEESKIRSVLSKLKETDKPTDPGPSSYKKETYGSDCFDMTDTPSTATPNTHTRFEDAEPSDRSIDSFKDLVNTKYETDDILDLTSFDDTDLFYNKQEPNKELDRLYQSEFEKKKNNPKYVKMMEFRRRLPSFPMRSKIVKTILSNQVVVISGETGCGKTTQVPQFILDEEIEQGRGSQCHIICTQPRRISAISVAERVAQERGVNCKKGEEVGFMIRLESKVPRPRGSVMFCTTGCVLKFLESDPLLTRATHIIIDEVHERDLQSDFLMIVLKDILSARPDLKVILMSATLNAEMFSEYFGNCPMLHIPGFTFPVEEHFLEDVMDMVKYRAVPNNSGWKPRLFGEQKQIEEEKRQKYEEWLRSVDGQYLPTTIESLRLVDDKKVDLDLVKKLLHHIVSSQPDGAILVFVPGWSEISTLNKLLSEDPTFSSDSCLIIPLHSLMPTVNQREVFERPPQGVRKIVIATNIAETSITIDDIVYVIDCGKIKMKDFEPENNLTTLESKTVARANAKQRKGRAGRVQAGICYRLYTRHDETQFIDYFPPEMLRTRLEEICLQIKILKFGSIKTFISKAIEPPHLNSLDHAIECLRDLNALDCNENLLPLGYHLARMPVDPHTGKMILFGAMFGCLDPILTVAASLGFKTAFYTPMGKEEEADYARKELAQESGSDHILLINTMAEWESAMSKGNERQFCFEYFLSSNVVRLLRDMKKQLATLLREVGFTSNDDPKDRSANINSRNTSLVKAIVCAGLYPNVGKIGKIPKMRNKQRRLQTVKIGLKSGNGAALHPISINAFSQTFDHKWVVFHKKLKTSGIYIHDCTPISPYPLLLFGGEIKLCKDGTEDLVSVDDWIVFKANPETASLVKDLRSRLDKVLEEKITEPGPTNWKYGSKEGALMKLIEDLVTKEDTKISLGS